MLTTFLSELGTAGESAAEYLALYQTLLQESPWKQYLALQGVLIHLADFLTAEIEVIHKYEGSVLTSDLSQGKRSNDKYFNPHVNSLNLASLSDITICTTIPALSIVFILWCLVLKVSHSNLMFIIVYFLAHIYMYR